MDEVMAFLISCVSANPNGSIILLIATLAGLLAVFARRKKGWVYALEPGARGKLVAIARSRFVFRLSLARFRAWFAETEKEHDQAQLKGRGAVRLLPNTGKTPDGLFIVGEESCDPVTISGFFLFLFLSVWIAMLVGMWLAPGRQSVLPIAFWGWGALVCFLLRLVERDWSVRWRWHSGKIVFSTRQLTELELQEKIAATPEEPETTGPPRSGILWSMPEVAMPMVDRLE